LVELLVACTILAILASAGALVFTGGVRTSVKVRRQGRMLSRGQAVLELLGRDLRGALLHQQSRLTALDATYEGRQADTVDLIVARHPGPDDEEGAACRREVGYYIDNDPDTAGTGLVRRVDDTMDADALEGGTLTPAGTCVSELNLEFYDGVAWVDGWDDPSRFPTAIRITILVVDDELVEHPLQLITTVAVMAR
jgi:type II secretion system protein J